MVTSKLVGIAKQVSAQELASAAEIQEKHIFKNKSCSLRVVHASSLTPTEKEHIWALWEANMRKLVEPSSFGWNPKEKKRELFHRDARFILVLEDHDQDAAEHPETAAPLVAYSTFRFEREEGEDIVYCYELQVSEPLRNSGVGQFLIEKLAMIGKHWGMTKIVLTVLKSNTGARRFYSKTGFQVDPTSPEYVSSEDEDARSSEEGMEQGIYDYEILSRSLG